MMDSASGLKPIGLKLTGIRLYAFILLLLGLIMITIETIWSYWDLAETWATYPPEFMNLPYYSIVQLTGVYLIFVAIFCFSFIILNRMERVRSEGIAQPSTYEDEGIGGDYGPVTSGVGMTQFSWVTLSILAIGFTLMVSAILFSYLDMLNRMGSADIEYHARILVIQLNYIFYFSGISILVYLLLKERGGKRPIIDNE
jgi:hypothetical protein